MVSTITIPPTTGGAATTPAAADTLTLEEMLGQQKAAAEDLASYFKAKSEETCTYFLPKEIVKATLEDHAQYSAAMKPNASTTTIIDYVNKCLTNGWIMSAKDVINKHAKPGLLTGKLQMPENIAGDELQRLVQIYKIYADLLYVQRESKKLEKHYKGLEALGGYLQQEISAI